ncbi:hypothetical protein GCM10010392_65840 [Streptomyces clavifer]|nr:hypothetical protein GCM10010392_65840 [Streptomyces clavifer]
MRPWTRARDSGCPWLVPQQATLALLTKPEGLSTRGPRQELSVANAMLTPTPPLPVIIQGFR